VTKRSLPGLLCDVLQGRIEPGLLTFGDLQETIVERELARLSERGRTGPHAENILRDLGIVGARPH
jgi:pyruvate ferredoxin oxidoreductase alpha subunit